MYNVNINYTSVINNYKRLIKQITKSLIIFIKINN